MTEIKNLKKAAQRILKAIKNKEKIILYGDADMDGVTAVIILEETIKNLDGDIAAVYFPDRETEGYGMTEKGLDYLKNFSPALLVVLDCGIGNFKEAKMAKKLGFELIIVDHHETLDKLPEASIIVAPKQKGDKYLFKELATAGIAFKLSEALLKNQMRDNLRKNLLELAALATLADMMPQENENRTMTEEGLASLRNSWRPGIRAFLESDLFSDYSDFRQKLSRIISLLNVRDVQERLPASFRLLTTSSLKEAEKIIEDLSEKAILRKQKIKEITDQAELKISLGKETPIIFAGDALWELTLLGPVASTILQRYKKPTFLFKKMEKESQGTIRSPDGINSVTLLKKCKKHLISYGGHPRAAGFRIKNENLENFKDCLICHFEQ